VVVGHTVERRGSPADPGGMRSRRPPVAGGTVGAMEILHSAEFESAIGLMRAVSSDRGLAYVELPHASGRGLAGWIERHATGARLLEDYARNRLPIAQLREFLEGKRREFDLHLDLRGTDFQMEVYRCVSAIDFGETLTYTDIANAVGKPRAVRAVGAANGANPLPLVVPCHRVVGKGGHLQGYAGGLPLKAKLLAMEMESSQPGQGRLL
jgi:methylated-DNA-[protein]-cysteine S-methyltransferase